MKKYMTPIAVIASSLVATAALANGTIVAANLISDGTFSQWDATGAGPHYQLVDEGGKCNSTDYVYTDVNGEKDSYNVDLSQVPNGAHISTIILGVCAAERAAPGKGWTDGFQGFVKVNGGAEQISAVNNLTTTLFREFTSGTLQFGGGVVTKDESTTLEVGVKYPVGERGGVKVSRVRAWVDYDE